MGMSSFVPHILYENNDQLYIGYSHEIDVRNLYNEVNALTVQGHVASMYLKCRSFEDFPLAFTEMMESIRYELVLPNHHTSHHRNLIFTSVAELTGQKIVVDRIDLRRDFLKLWSTEITMFMNLTESFITIICNDNEQKFLAPGEAIQLIDGCQPLSLVQKDRGMNYILKLAGNSTYGIPTLSKSK
jgi:hypothetical protein